jgi:hypothetical protein
MELEQQRRGPATCGVAIEVPSKTAKRDLSVFGRVDEST